MDKKLRRTLRYLAIALALVGACFAQQVQQPVPHAAYVYPAGGQQGTTFEVTVGGQFLQGAREALVSGNGVKVEVVGVHQPLNGMQLQEVREELQKLVQSHGGPPGQFNPNAQRRPNPQQQQRQQKREERQQQKQPAEQQKDPAAAGQPNAQQAPPANTASQAPSRPITPWTPEDLARAKELRDKVESSTRRLTAPALAQSVTLRVTLAPDAVPGTREVRLMTAQGLTNPLVFCVGQLPEISKPFQWVPMRLAAGGGVGVRDDGVRPPARTDPQPITLPAIVNGQMMPAAADRYRFHAVKGRHLVIAAQTRGLIPYISDAVPGWFQATVTLYDSSGRELASADHFRYSQDPVIEREIPENGEYVVEIHDAIFRGREDFVYRLAIGDLPFVTSIFPLGAKQGAKAKLEIGGANLTAPRFTPSTKMPGLRLLSAADGWNANPVPLLVDTLPEQTQTQPAAGMKNAKKVKLPVVINGRIAKPGDSAIFRIDAKQGEEMVAEVFARRLGSPLDSVLVLTDAKGKQLAANDDFDDKAAALLTHQADSRIAFRFPAKGRYFLQIADAQQSGGPDFAYRLRISHPEPDFELRVVPSSLSLRPGMTTAATVYALRRDGFSGDIALHIKDGPAGLVLNGGTIPPGADSVRVTFTAPAQSVPAPQKLLLEGEASIAGRNVRRVGVPADDMEQAFAWHHLVPAQEAYVAVFGGGRRNAIWKVDGARLKLPAGGTAQIRIGIPAAPFVQQAQVQLALDDPPDGITIENITKENNALSVRFKADAKAKPGVKGNLILDASMLRPPNPQNPRPAQNRPVPLGTLPAIPFEIVQQ